MIIRNVDRRTLVVPLSTDDFDCNECFCFCYSPQTDSMHIADGRLLLGSFCLQTTSNIDCRTPAVPLLTDDTNLECNKCLCFSLLTIDQSELEIDNTYPVDGRQLIDTLTQIARQTTFVDSLTKKQRYSLAQYYCLLSTAHLCYRLIDRLPTAQYVPRTWPKKQVYSASVCTCPPSKQHQNKLSQTSLHDRPKLGQRLSKLNESARTRPFHHRPELHRHPDPRLRRLRVHSVPPLSTVHRYPCFDSDQLARQLIRTVLKTVVYRLIVHRLHPRSEPHRRLEPQRPRRPRVRHVHPLWAAVHRYPCFDLGQPREQTRKTTKKQKKRFEIQVGTLCNIYIYILILITGTNVVSFNAGTTPQGRPIRGPLQRVGTTKTRQSKRTEPDR